MPNNTETDKTKEDESATETKEEDRTESKAETIKYVYGNGLISQTDTNGCRYYHYNHLGSTMQLTDKDGNVTDRYTYGTYGELLSGDTEHTRFLYNGRYGVTTDENGLYYMRTRYYNTDIRRFINQDIITGSIGNSRSLNRYAYVQGNPVSYTDPFGLSPLNAMADTVGHAVLDLIGSIPVFGAPANILNCYWYYKEKNYEMAVMSGIAILPGVGQFIGAGLKAFKYTRAAQYIITTTKFAGSMANCMIAVGTCIDTGKRIYHDIRNGKFGLNVNTVANIATIGISAFAAAVSGKEMAGAGVELTNMVAEDTTALAGKVKEAVGNLGSKIKNSLGTFGREIEVYASEPQNSINYKKILNVGAGTRSIPCAINIDINPTIEGVIFGDVNDLSQFADGSFDHVIALNPYNYNLLDSDVPRILKDEGIMSVAGNYSNKYFKKIYNASPENLRQAGFEIVSKGEAAGVFIKYGGKVTGGDREIKGRSLQIILRKVGG